MCGNENIAGLLWSKKYGQVSPKYTSSDLQEITSTAVGLITLPCKHVGWRAPGWGKTGMEGRSWSQSSRNQTVESFCNVLLAMLLK